MPKYSWIAILDFSKEPILGAINNDKSFPWKSVGAAIGLSLTSLNSFIALGICDAEVTNIKGLPPRIDLVKSTSSLVDFGSPLIIIFWLPMSVILAMEALISALGIVLFNPE